MPATVEFADIAGAAAAGRRAGAARRRAVPNADALLHVVRVFRDPSVPHPPGSVDPARDAQTMEDELILADLGVAERRLERLESDLKKAQRRRAREGTGRPACAAAPRSKTARRCAR